MRITQLVEILEQIREARGDIHVLIQDADGRWPVGPRSVSVDAADDGEGYPDEEGPTPAPADVVVVPAVIIDITADPGE